jgi:thiamine biosynthesis lipoprotein
VGLAPRHAALRRLIAAIVVIVASGCARAATVAPESRLIERIGLAMGAEVKLTAWAPDTPAAATAFDEVFREFERLEALMSVWRDGSDIQRLNAAAGRTAVPVSAEVRDVLRDARQVSEWTEGKFDVTFGALSGLWKFDHDQDDRIPDAGEVRRRLPLIDFRALELDERAGSAFLERAGMRVHLGGIGKGYAIDRAVALLIRRGIRHFIIQSGGDMYAAGRRGTRPWRLGIRDPRGPSDRSFAALDVTDATFSTSGDYERFFVHDGRRYHHILDPDRGEPARGCRSVTIVTDRAVIADGLSTGVFVLGSVAGMALIERLPGVEGVIVTDSNEVLVSSGLRDRLIRIGEPTK